MSSTQLLLVLILALLVAVVIIVFLVRKSGGSVDARGRLLGLDLRVRVSTPARARAAEHLGAAAQEKNAHGDLAAAREAVHRLRTIERLGVLWVDDNPDGNVNEVLMLLTLGFRITQAVSSPAARQYLEEGEFRLMITDLRREDDPEEGIRFVQFLKDRTMLPQTVVYSRDPGERGARAIEAGAASLAANPAQLLQTLLHLATS